MPQPQTYCSSDNQILDIDKNVRPVNQQLSQIDLSMMLSVVV